MMFALITCFFIAKYNPRTAPPLMDVYAPPVCSPPTNIIRRVLLSMQRFDLRNLFRIAFCSRDIRTD